MWFRIGSVLLGLILAVSLSAVALAQSDQDGPTSDSAPASAPDASTLASDQTPAARLVLQVTLPTDLDVEVPLETAELTVQGLTAPGAVVSVDGDLAAVDARGNFVDVAALTEGANAIDVVASDDQGNQVTTTLYVVRGG